MCYKAVCYFEDLQDNNHAYYAGDVFPRENMTVSKGRIKELETNQNRQKKPLIKKVEEKAKKAKKAVEE